MPYLVKFLLRFLTKKGRPMMNTRKLDSAITESLAEQQLCKSGIILHILRKSGSVRLVELGLMAGWLASRQTKMKFKNFNAYFISKCLTFYYV